MSDGSVRSAVDEAAARLYAAPVDDFMALRTQLATTAKSAGDAVAAKAIVALRKPTVGASVVNRLVLADASVAERLVGLGDRLRRAQQELDAAQLRELTTERRATVAEITRAAFAHADRGDATTALRDEVSATFDAAVADPDVADRLGRLVRGESFSGFGVVPGGPELTLVQGGRGTARRSPATSRAARPAAPSAAPAADERGNETPAPPPAGPRLTRRLERARAEFGTADEQFTAAESVQERESTRVRTLSDELRELQRELEDAKRALDQARRDVRTVRARRREARAALDRAERAVERGTDA